MRARTAVLCISVVTTLLAAPAFAQRPPAQVDQATKDEARSHFEQGIAHFDREEWSAALAEFLRSRELFPTRAATKNAGTCLRKEKRYDEALEMFESLLRDFSDLPAADKTFAEREIADLQPSVGTIEIRGAEAGASILVDGKARGTTPLDKPLRVSAGTRVVRAYKEGFLPFETRIDVAGRSAAAVEVKLQAMTRSGRLKVSESGGKALDVVVDNDVVGKTPWEGATSPGDHVVLLRGEGADAALGTQPVAAPVHEGQVTPLTLVAEPLEGQARIVPTPAGATIAIDGVAVGHGLWEGRLRAGSHKVEVGAEGFLPVTRQIVLEKNKRAVIAIELERDRSSKLFAERNPPRVFFEVTGALSLAPLFGGDVLDGCSGACSSGLPLGFRAVGHGGYELGSGIGFGLAVGYVQVSTKATGRATEALPTGIAPNQGTADDELRLGGLLVGAAAGYHSRGTSWPLLLRLGAGVLLGSVKDARTGTFTTSAGVPYRVDVSQSASATYLVVSPEARIGRRLGDHFEVNVGVALDMMVGLATPTWEPSASTFQATGDATRGDGQAQFASSSVAGSTLLVISPGLGARYDF